MCPDIVARTEQKAEKILASMPLQELRAAREISQEKLAKALNMKQPSVSKMEKRTDMYISSLRSAVFAMGGELEIIAKFPDGAIKINQFESLESKQFADDIVGLIVDQRAASSSISRNSSKLKGARTRVFDPQRFFSCNPINIEAAREIPRWTPLYSNP